jgi:predicted heme/steroid binding protein
MKNRRIAWIFIAALLAVSLAACGAPASKPSASAVPAASAAAAPGASAAAQGKVFTLDELAKYNGQNGMPAYVAVDGVVYDVSNVSLWQGGSHQGLHQAGQDMTQEIKQSPHGKQVLAKLPVVGTLAK